MRSRPALFCTLVLLVPLAAAAEPAAAEPPAAEPPFRVVDLDVGQAVTVELADGQTVSVKLVELEETRDSVRDAVRRAVVTVDVDGRRVRLVSASYHLPTRVGAVQIDCPVTEGYNRNGTPAFWALDKAARLRIWPADSPWLTPGTFGYPVKQRWFATLTQMANVPTYVDGGERPATPRIYYHSGLDIGGAEGLVEVVAATDGLVVSAADQTLAEHRRENDTPVSPRYDVVYLRDARGWYYRYSHMQEIDPQIKPGRVVRRGDRIGLLGKEGGSGGWSHLHFEIKARQPSGRWGTQAGYAFLWEAYLREHRPPLIAVARPHHLLWSGETAELDAGKSWSSSRITEYQWQFHDGRTASGPQVRQQYDQPGTYSEVVKVTDAAGRTAYDFAVVQVIDRQHPERVPPTIHPAYAPTFGIRPGDPVTFLVRTFRTTDGQERWDFGDGSPPVVVQSDGNAVKLAPDGYARTTHRYQQAGDYLVRVEREDRFGQKAVGHLHVRVGQ